MADLFQIGGPIFMGILTIILIAVIAASVYIFTLKGKENTNIPSATLVKEIGIFAMITGIFGQFIGLFEAFNVIEQMGSVSPDLLIGGLKVSSITTLYGLAIFLFSNLLYFGLKISSNSE